MLTHLNEDVKYSKIMHCMILRCKETHDHCTVQLYAIIFMVTIGGTRISIMVMYHSGMIAVSIMLNMDFKKVQNLA